MNNNNNNNNEYQNVTEKYKNLNAGDRIVFRTLLDLALILLKNQQDQKGG